MSFIISFPVTIWMTFMHRNIYGKTTIIKPKTYLGKQLKLKIPAKSWNQSLAYAYLELLWH